MASRYSKGRQREQEILTATLDVLAQHGYRGTTLRAIARELGLQTTHLLHYFPSKEALFEAVITQWDATSLEFADTHGGGFLASWPDVVAENTTVPGLVHLYTAFAAEAADDAHPSRKFFLERFAGIRRTIEDEIIARHPAEHSGSVDPRATATRLISFSDGLQLQWLIDPTIDMAAELRAVIAILVPEPS